MTYGIKKFKKYLIRVDVNEQGAVTGINRTTEAEKSTNHPVILQVFQQLAEYFNGTRKTFDLNLSFEALGTPFQQAVWQQLLVVTYGQTTTYGELATQIDNPKAYRAVGSAVGKNPFLIVVPCHRVLRSDRQIGNFRCGPEMKADLLKLEGALITLPL